jgi:hypothetical protein
MEKPKLVFSLISNVMNYRRKNTICLFIRKQFFETSNDPRTIGHDMVAVGFFGRTRKFADAIPRISARNEFVGNKIFFLKWK